MPEGDLITTHGQYELRGLLLGRGTDYLVEQVDGLMLPAMRSVDVPIEGGDGSRPGVDTLDDRQVILSIAVRADDRAALATKLEALAAAFAPVTTAGETLPFVYRMATGRTRRLNVRPRRVAGRWGPLAPHGVADGVVAELIAPDPYVYDQTELVQSWDIAGGGTNTGQGIVGNTSTARAVPVIVIDGPATDPSVELSSPAREIKLVDTLIAGESIRLDLGAKTIEKRDTPGSVWYLWPEAAASDNEWWTLPPGASTITFRRSVAHADPATITVTYRPAFYSGV